MYLFGIDVEWTLYEEVAVAAMDCQCLDVAKVDPPSSLLWLTIDIWFSWTNKLYA